MSFSDAEMEQLDSSYATLRASIASHPGEFYAALFRHAPAMRGLFREDLEGQGMKFMTTLGVILSRLKDEDAGKTQYQELGRKHAALGVTSADFAPMEAALIETLGKELESGLTPELEALWRRAFQTMSARMIRRGGIRD